MNKKLKKGLTTTMAAAMGLGVVIPAVPVIAAPATSGWVNTAAGWTYYKAGTKATGWVLDGGKWYFLDSNGIMKTGWVKDAGTWYYLTASGAMATGWFKDVDGSWYFLNTSGAMAASTWVGNYYVGASGAMLANTLTPDNYYVDANGAWDGKAKYDLVAIEAAVKKAETTKAQADVDAAKALVNALPAVKEKDAFTTRLNKIVVNLEVVSVNSVNAREIVVTFNTALDEATAEVASNYALTVAGVAETNFTVNFDANDPTKVTLELTDAAKLANNEAVQLVVKDNVLAASSLTGLSEDYSKVWVFNDTTAPTISKVERSGNDIVVTFNEYVTTADVIKVNGKSFTPPAASSPTTKTITITNGVLNLPAGTYDVLLSGVDDVLGNKSALLKTSITVSEDTTAPSISKVEQVADNQIAVTFDKAVSLVGSNNFVVKKNGYNLTVAAATTDSLTYTLTLTDAAPVLVYDTDANTSAVSLVVSGFKATANDIVGNSYSTSLTLSKDKTAPTVVSRFNGITDIGVSPAVNEVFEIHFNEDLTLVGVAGDITLTDNNGVRQVVSGVSVVNDANGDAKILRVESAAVQTAGAIATGTYNINLPTGFVTDAAANDIAATNVSITKSASASTVTATASALSNVITVNYGSPMTTTATSLANYTLDGKALPAGTNIYFDTTTQVVKIELPAGSITSTGGAVLTISDNVVSTTGNKIATAGKTQNITTGFVDNVKPTLLSAKKTSSTTIELTFDENIDDATLAALAADNDFIVKVNGVSFAYTAATGTTANDNKIVLTTTPAYNTAQAVTVSVTSTTGDISITDGANLLNAGTTVTAAN